MRRILIAGMIVPAALVAADQDMSASTRLMGSVLSMGVTHDRPFLPSSRIESNYQAARTLAARLQTQVLAGTIATPPQAEITAAARELDARVAAVGALTAIERGQYQEAMLDLEAVVSMLAASGFGAVQTTAVKPAKPVEPVVAEPPVTAPVAVPAEVPATKPADAPGAPVEVAPPAAAPATQPAVELPPVEAPKAEEPKPADAPKAEEPKPADAPKAEEPKPADAPKVEEPKPADAPKAEEPKPADAPKVEEEKPKPATELPPE